MRHHRSSLCLLAARSFPLSRRLLLFAYVTDGSSRFAFDAATLPHHPPWFTFVTATSCIISFIFSTFLPLHTIVFARFCRLCCSPLLSRLLFLTTLHLRWPSPCAVVAPLGQPHFISSLPSLSTLSPSLKVLSLSLFARHCSSPQCLVRWPALLHLSTSLPSCPVLHSRHRHGQPPAFRCFARVPFARRSPTSRCSFCRHCAALSDWSLLAVGVCVLVVGTVVILVCAGCCRSCGSTVVRCGLARCCWPTLFVRAVRIPFVLQPPRARSLAVVVATMGGVDRASLTIDGPRAVVITLGSCYPGAFVRRCVVTRFVFAGVLPLSTPNSSTWFCYSLVIFPSASSSPPSHPVIHSFRFACLIINLLPSHPLNPICRSFIVEHNQRIVTCRLRPPFPPPIRLSGHQVGSPPQARAPVAGRPLFKLLSTLVLLGASCMDRVPSSPSFPHHHPRRQHPPTSRVAAVVDHCASHKSCAGSVHGRTARSSFFFFSFTPTSLRRRSRCRRRASLRCSLASERCCRRRVILVARQASL